jgi:hypothetical protein
VQRVQIEQELPDNLNENSAEQDGKEKLLVYFNLYIYILVYSFRCELVKLKVKLSH